MTRCYCSSDRGREANERFNAHGAIDRHCRNCGRWMKRWDGIRYSYDGLVSKEQRIKIALQSIKGRLL